MKRVLLMVFSVVLILACIFGLFSCVSGVRDIMNINEYKNADAAYARENLETARDGIAQLKENEETYITGVGTYTDGLSQYTAGKETYYAGLAEYNQGKADYAAGQQELAEGYAAYEAGKKQVEEGQAQIDANTEAYNEGKALLEKIEPLMPYLTQYKEFRDGTIANLPGFSTAQTWFMAVVRPLASQLGLSIPSDVTDFPAYMEQMVAEGKAQLKQYEDGLATLEAGKAQLAEAEKALAEGEQRLAEGKAKLEAAEAQLSDGEKSLADAEIQLADGKAQLSVFEQGELTLAAGGAALIEGMPPCYSYYGGEETVLSLGEYLANEFGVAIPDNLIVVENGEAKLNEDAYSQLSSDVLNSMYKVDENGNRVEKNGYAMLDLDKCSKLCDLAEQYLVDQEADIKSEVYVRIGMYAVLAIACVLGIIAGIMGIVAGAKGSKRTGKTLGIISAVLSVGVLVAGYITDFADYVYTVRLDEAGAYVGETAAKLDFTPVQQYSGSLQFTAIWVMAAAAVVFAIFAIIASSAAKNREAALAAAAADDDNDAVYAAAAAAAAAAASETKAETSADEQVIAAAETAASDEETVAEAK